MTPSAPQFKMTDVEILEFAFTQIEDELIMKLASKCLSELSKRKLLSKWITGKEENE